jgi:hypothetical protein
VIRRWVLACAVAESVGMSASAGAARGAQSLGATAGLLLLVLGGLVEGTALGFWQGTVMRARAGSSRWWWVLVTVVVAGIGWAAASAPAALSGDSSGSAPPLGWVLTGAAALGTAMGALLGLAQTLVLRRSRTRHPWRWVSANAAGWTAAMPVVFAGATTAGASWPWPVLVCWGAATGALAGAVLGLVTGAWLPALDGLPVRHRAVLRWLMWRHADSRAGWAGLAVIGRRSGRALRFPVMTAPLGDRSLVVLPAHPERKSWWRQIQPDGEVGVLDDGTWRSARAHVVRSGSLDWSAARAAYVARWPQASVSTEPLVVVELRPVPASRRQDQGPAERGPGAVGEHRRASLP